MDDIIEALRRAAGQSQPLDLDVLHARTRRRAARRRRLVAGGTIVMVLGIAAVAMLASPDTSTERLEVQPPAEPVPTDHVDTPQQPSHGSATTLSPGGPPGDAPISPRMHDCTIGDDLPVEAHAVLHRFMAAVVANDVAALGGDVPDRLAAAPSLRADAADSAGPVERISVALPYEVDNTRISFCVLTYRQTDDELIWSLDGVVLTGEHQTWEVQRWLHGAGVRTTEQVMVPVVFLAEDHGCGSDDDHFVTVQVPVPSPQAPSPSIDITTALQELQSGPSGRAPGATTAIPLDLRLRGTPVVEFDQVYVEPVPSQVPIDDCTNALAIEQLRRTAEAASASAGSPTKAIIAPGGSVDGRLGPPG